MSEKQKKPKQPDWLQRVQEQSWEPELLISGLVLFALFQMPELIDSFDIYLDRQVSQFYSNSTINETIGALLKISVYVLMTGFITHIFIRSIWVAYAGLSYLYKDGIDLSRIKQPEIFKRDLKGRSYVDRINTLEKISSGIFSLSFLFFMIILGLITVGIAIALLVYLVINFFPDFRSFNLINLVFLLLGPLYVIDLITLGFLRRIPYLSLLYYPFYKVGRYLMLAPLYEDIYYGFITHNKKWKVALLTFAFSVTFILAYAEVRFPGKLTSSFQLRIETNDDYLLYDGHYGDRLNKNQAGRAIIPSDIIRNNVLRVFIPHLIENEQDYFVQQCFNKLANENNDLQYASNENKHRCLNDLYKLAVNDSVFSTEGLFQYDHTVDISGMVYWLDISHLTRGPQNLTVYRKRVNPDTTFEQRIAKIEFFKDIQGTDRNLKPD